jgi:hypothetical protein
VNLVGVSPRFNSLVRGLLKENKMLNLPFNLKEENVNENWEPDLHQEYLVVYDWHKGNPEILIGKFSKTWYGFTFRWCWSASSLQLSTNNKNGSNPDWKHFKQVFKLTRKSIPLSNENENFITNKDIEI